MEAHYTGFLLVLGLKNISKISAPLSCGILLDVSLANLLARLIIFIFHFHLRFLPISRPYKRDTERRNSVNFLL